MTVFAVAYAIGAPLLGAALGRQVPRCVLTGSLVLFAASSRYRRGRQPWRSSSLRGLSAGWRRRCTARRRPPRLSQPGHRTGPAGVAARPNSLYSHLGVLLGTATQTVGLWLFIAAFGVGGMAGTWWGGAAADRLGGPRVVLTAGCLLTAGFAVLPFAAANPAAAVAVIACWGFAGWAFVPGQQHHLLGLVPGPAPFLLALNSSAIQLGFAAGALLGGLVVDAAGADFLWILAVACGTAGMIMHVVTHLLSREPQS